MLVVLFPSVVEAEEGLRTIPKGPLSTKGQSTFETQAVRTNLNAEQFPLSSPKELEVPNAVTSQQSERVKSGRVFPEKENAL